jgi:hypothetical protein
MASDRRRGICQKRGRYNPRPTSARVTLFNQRASASGGFRGCSTMRWVRKFVAGSGALF